MGNAAKGRASSGNVRRWEEMGGCKPLRNQFPAGESHFQISASVLVSRKPGNVITFLNITSLL